jgi:hypothetical protein
MRRLLGVLREDAAAVDAADSALPSVIAAEGLEAAQSTAFGASRQPQPGLRQLAELIDAARDAAAAGTRLIISGPVTPLDPGVELAAYRIVQEALTNTRRHAPGAAVDVELHYSRQALRLRVRDNGPGPAAVPGGSDQHGPSPTSDSAGPASSGGRPEPGSPLGQPTGGGHGLLGMRERAFSVGGSLYTGMAPRGGFLVEALLPAGQDLVEMSPAATGTEGLAAETGAGR